MKRDSIRSRTIPSLKDITEGDLRERAEKLLLVFDPWTKETTKDAPHILKHYGFDHYPGPKTRAIEQINEGLGYLIKEGYVRKYSTDPDFYQLTRKGKSEQRRLLRKGELEEKMAVAIIIIVGLAVIIFFLSNNMTGNAINYLDSITTNNIGIILLFIGIVSTFIYFRKRKKINSNKNRFVLGKFR